MDWDHSLIGERLPAMSRPCKDCAVVCGLYREYSELLKLEPTELRREVSDRWFCHNHPNRSCAGNMIAQDFAEIT